MPTMNRGPGQTLPEQSLSFGVRPSALLRYGVFAALVLVVGVFYFWWYQARIQVDPGKLVPVLQREGDPLPNELALAPNSTYQGIQLETLLPGRYFRNPIDWWWSEPVDQLVVPPGKVAVLTRMYGKPLPPGERIARSEDQMGTLEKALLEGMYPLNPWAYDVEMHDVVSISPGFRGIVTLLAGKPPADPNVFVVQKGECGTQPYLLPPGQHPEYSNPYVWQVTKFDVRSQKFDISGVNVVTFPSVDSFDITLEGTIEWAVNLERLPETFVKYVDKDDLAKSGGLSNLQDKLILAFARSFSRIVGGRHRAVDFLTGTTKMKVQTEMESRLKSVCALEGVEIRSFVIHDTKPPQQIRDQYARRELARREIDQFQKEILTEIGQVVVDGAKPKLGADGKPEVDEYGNPVLEGGTPKVDAQGKTIREGGKLAKMIETQRKDRSTKLGEVRAQVAEELRRAEQYKVVEVTKAQRDLEVAQRDLKAAKDRAAAQLAEGTSKAAVTLMKSQAKADGIKAKVAAIGGGAKYAESAFSIKLAPAIGSIASPTEGPFADLFLRFSASPTTRPAGGK